MNGYVLLFLFVLGIWLLHVPSSIMSEMEKDPNMDEGVYMVPLAIALSGLTLSVLSLIKLVREIHEQFR